MLRSLPLALILVGCGGNPKGNGDGGDPLPPDACVGLECDVVDCRKMGLPPTTITGTVFAPNGTLPLNNVNVYVPRDVATIMPFADGVSCDRCTTDLPGGPVRSTVSDASGNFRLENVPAGANVPLVVTTGKWRRIVTLANVNQCTDNALPAADTRLPRSKAEGEIPKIALTTGDADSMECLVRKLMGIDTPEITNESGAGRIHFYVGDGVDSIQGGGNLTSATPFWSTEASLSRYDIVILSCEGSQMGDSANKTQAHLNAMKAYADKGGRVFASHWHNIWISGNFQNGNPGLAPQRWNTVATWADAGNFDGNVTIDEQSNPVGGLFADWMLNVGASTTRGQFPVNEGRTTALTLTSDAERWAVRNNNPQMFQFTTPLEVGLEQRCGKVVFTDMHVSGTTNNNAFPTNCNGGANNTNLTPQEKALAFMFFDIAGCVGIVF